MRFLPCSELIPVFPPIEASAWASKVVGIFTNFNPLLAKFEIKADKSPITPPPKAIMQSDLLKLYF